MNQINKYAGARVKEARAEMKVSQRELANYLDLSFQMIQKYERGASHMSISRLCDISEYLSKPIWYFFPPERGGDMALLGIKLEAKLNKYRDNEDRILQILTER